MLTMLVAAALILAGQQPEATAIIAGAVVAPPEQAVSQPVQVILLPPQYVHLWNSEVQKRLDTYWQQYLQTFRSQKELFSEFSRLAHKDATTYVLTRMRGDSTGKSSEYQLEISFDGRFEFKNVPFGEYKILALGKIGNQDVMWHEFIDIRSALPHFLELKKRVP
jgi:hypothetical protein